MNICITLHDMEPQYMCGIKRVLSILTNEWIGKCNITIVSVSPQGTKYNYFGDVKQYILPDNVNLLSEENHKYFCEIVKHEYINIILNPYAHIKELTQLCIDIKNREGIKFITALHFSITHDVDILNSYFFNKYRVENKPVAWIKECFLFLKYHLYTKQKIKSYNFNYYNQLIEDSDKLVLLSDSLIHDLEVATKRKSIKNVIAINNPMANTIENATTEKGKKILWCGRLEYNMKRTDRILDIWKDFAPQHTDWELIIMGSGDVKHFETQAKNMNLTNITFTGSCDPDEYYKNGAILCMTSSTEGWPMVLMEAMSKGCIPVAYNSFTSLKDIITNDVNGCLVSPFNKKEYIKKVEKLISDDKYAHKLRVNAIETIKKFNKVVIAQKWLDLFEEVTK